MRIKGKMGIEKDDRALNRALMHGQKKGYSLFQTKAKCASMNQLIVCNSITIEFFIP